MTGLTPGRRSFVFKDRSDRGRLEFQARMGTVESRTVSSGVRTLLVVIPLVVAALARAGDLYDRDSGREVALFGAGAAIGVGALWVAAELEPLDGAELDSLDAADLPAFDRVATRLWSPAAATASDVTVLTSVAAPLLLLTGTGDGMDAGDLGVMYVQTLLLEHATIGLLKGLVRRPRPLAYNTDPRIPPELRRSRHAVRSFPSGHTSTAFAAAVFVGEVYARLHPDDASRHWVRAGGLALAATTGWLRIRAGRHFPSDVLAGAIIGSLAGWAVPRLHEVEAAGAAGREAPTRGPGLVFGFAF
jgi:membrane-associated phospholipid phosphatase